MTTETWKPVPGYEGAYEVSDLGRVRSLDRVIVRSDGVRRRFPGKIIKPYVDPNGYDRVALALSGSRSLRCAHQLVAAAFLGPRPVGQEVRHIRGVAGGHGVDNLEYGTPTENNADKVRHGTLLRGEDVGTSKLDEAAVRAIREARGVKQRDLAARFGCRQGHISRIVNRQRWRHVA